MSHPLGRILLGVTCLFWAACASRPLPKYEKPLARASVQSVRTTAYTHTEEDHRPYAQLSAAGTPLRYGTVKSAAADWSRWPAGTLFRIAETGEVREVDDYGWALAGTNTIDLYQPSRGSMNSWGVRRVTIEILRWGDAWQSHAILRPRGKYAHVQRMLKQIEERYPRGRAEAAPIIAQANPTPASPEPQSQPAPIMVKKGEIVSVAGSAPRPAQMNPFYR
jgi:3D (Asp-Asp-Asp) domain-containing protein